ncbi:endonuclease/exonuclease/phosphatase family protein [Fimbriimonas ginsengisoli]|uniref:Endonuclease/exonuclease/phosphatase family protein n=1 Tax=Fimbriimonas ginsengisoli Gsoil 348 TaxID=661478 RepID=A0A068NP62_FIMGI|nr:endonuclease/exonuclease/phosphatase family protein [Fimbriimonas ginsengisoli]AIE85231.1 endonuclease/exonuclease/phosphatase family protein [Fimbriimonas ginsengisoli Gsoil 348]
MSILKVISYNVRCGNANDGLDSWPHRRDRTVAMLRQLDFDLAGLQEPLAFQLDDILTALPGYRLIGVGRDDGKRDGEYAAILYRTSRLRPIDSRTFWFSDTPDVPGSATWGNVCVRICTWSRFEDLVRGHTFTHFNVHVDHESQPSRERSSQLLLERSRATSGPVLITGDFNADEDSASIQILFDAGFRDTYRVIHPDIADVGTFGGFTDVFNPEKIDYILVDASADVRDAEIVKQKIDGRWPSDHAVMTASINYDMMAPTPCMPSS